MKCLTVGKTPGSDGLTNKDGALPPCVDYRFLKTRQCQTTTPFLESRTSQTPWEDMLGSQSWTSGRPFTKASLLKDQGS